MSITSNIMLAAAPAPLQMPPSLPRTLEAILLQDEFQPRLSADTRIELIMSWIVEQLIAFFGFLDRCLPGWEAPPWIQELGVFLLELLLLGGGIVVLYSILSRVDWKQLRLPSFAFIRFYRKIEAQSRHRHTEEAIFSLDDVLRQGYAQQILRALRSAIRRRNLAQLQLPPSATDREVLRSLPATDAGKDLSKEIFTAYEEAEYAARPRVSPLLEQWVSSVRSLLRPKEEAR